MIERESVNAVQNLLRDLPGAKITALNDYRLHAADAAVRFTHGDTAHTIIIEVKADGAPRFVRAAVHHLDSLLARLPKSDDAPTDAQPIPMLVCPYLPPASRAICRDHDIAYADLLGNARLAFNAVYIERETPDRPKAETRSLRSIFSPKAAAILRMLLHDPHEAWRVADLAKAANASLGHVSNVRKALLDREWAEKRSDGLVLAQPDALVKTWRESYRRPVGPQINAYTHLHGPALEERLHGVLQSRAGHPRTVYSRLSAAQWYAPFTRHATHTFYADEPGHDRLAKALELQPTTTGANVVVTIPTDETLFDDASEPAPHTLCTSPIVTYLDLWCSNEREREAAEHLAKQEMPWLT